MRICCDRIVKLKSNKFEYFLSKLRNDKNFDFDLLEVCVPNGYAISKPSIDDIDENKCTGCLLCLNKSDAKFIKENDSPSYKDSNRDLENISNQFFLGNYNDFSFSDKLKRHSKKSETTITNPLGGMYFWVLSEDPNDIYLRTSPNWELSIDTTYPLDEREGHLDIVIASGSNFIFVLEGKSSVRSLLDSEGREQWSRYKDNILRKANEYGFNAFFSYLIGGEELPLYPQNSSAPHHNERNEFYDFISKDDKKFISIEALRALRAFQLGRKNSFSWEKYFPSLFKSKRIKGILSGGIVYKRENYELGKAPWV